MKKIFKFSTTILLVLAITLSSFACSGGQKPLTAADVDFWGCHASVKILQDKPAENYTEYREEAKISLTMARGEFESSQIIMSPKKDVDYYNVSVSDLTNADGDKISKEKISVYHERYIEITKNPEQNGVDLGMYPDALVPMENIVEYGHNKFKAGENQGVYVTIETALDQPVGTYTGKITINFTDFEKEIPVAVEVVNVTVSEEANAKNIFLNDWDYKHGELNTTQELVDAYTEKLIEYRLAPQRVIEEYVLDDAGIEAYVNKMAEYLIRPRVSNLDIPYSSTTINNHSVIDPVVFEKVLNKFVEKSFELDFNLMRKLTLYNRGLDEATFFGMAPEKIKLNAKVFNTTIEKVASTLESDNTISADKDALRDEMVASIRKIPHVCTFPFSANYADFSTDEYINVNCPMFNYMDGEESRSQYCQSEKQPEMWWYGCDVPIYPYVNYHVDHKDTLNCRLLSWMQAEYNIVGNLYWATNDYNLQEDYYDMNGMGQPSSRNLEGMIFYPGGQYGILGPVASLRIEAIRDGLEEYEILIALKKQYEKLGFSSDDLVSSLSTSLYTGAKVIAELDSFKASRKSLLELAELVSSPAKLCLLGNTDNGNGTITSKVYMEGEYVLKNAGVAVTDKVAHNDGYIYSIQTNLNSPQNYLDLSYEAEGREYKYSQYLGGKVEKVEIDDMLGGFTEDPATFTAEKIDGTTIGASGEFIKLSYDEITDEAQRVILTSSVLSDKVGAQSSKMVFNIYNAGSEEIKITLSVKYKKSSIYTAEPAVMLKPGNNTIEINVSNRNWQKSGKIDKVRFWVGEGSEGYFAPKTIYIGQIYVYTK